jgi:quinol monooxygenase YgiN
MAERASVIRLSRFQPAAGKRDELIRVLETGAEGIRKLDGCFGAQICASRETPDVIVAISRWASQSAVDAFLEASAAERANLAGLTAAPPSAEHLVPAL